MKFDRKDLLIGFLIFVVIGLLVFRKRLSFADATPPMDSMGLNLVAQPNAAQLPSGAIMPKMVSEDCTGKYGQGWTRFTDTLCKKA